MPAAGLLIVRHRDHRVPLRARVAATLQAGTLDRRLRDGEPLDASPALERRALTIGRPHARRALAEGLESAARHARRPARGSVTARVRPQSEAGGAAFAPLTALAARLRDEDPPPRAQGVALARRLAMDGTGELWCWHEPGALRDAARAALEACDRAVGPSP